MGKISSLLGVSLLLAFLLLWPIQRPGDWYPMHDSTHPARIYLMKQTISGGQFPPIWAEHINNGFGYPLYHFYAPLYHTVSALISYAVTPTSALKISLTITIVVGALGAMVFARRWGRLASVVAGVLFALAPYAAVNIYVRGAFSELLSISILPWVLIATEKITNKKEVVKSAAVLSMFILSHNLIPLLALPLIGVWTLYHNAKNLRLLVAAGCLTVGLTAWFLGPLLFERSFTEADSIARTTNYSLHFVEPWQLWNSTWGFGGSASGVEDGMSFKLGKLHILLGLAGVIAAALKRKKSLLILAVFLGVSLFLSTQYSQAVWDASSMLQLVQFPWRNLGISSLLLSLFAGYAVSRVPFKAVRAGAGTAIIIAALILNYKYFRPQSIEQSALDREISEKNIPDIASVVPEFRPRWFHPTIEQMNTVPTRKDGYITTNRAYYPTWKVYLDTTEVPTSPSPEGFLMFPVLEGEHKVIMIQSHTALEKGAYAVTLISLGAAVLIGRRMRGEN